MTKLAILFTVLFLVGSTLDTEGIEFVTSPKIAKDDDMCLASTSCYLQYYYYIPCPDYSWFWSFSGWLPNDVIGVVFRIGDLSMQNWALCDSAPDYLLETIRVLDFSGFGTVYPGLYTVRFDVYCSDENGCPVGPSLWNSGPKETAYSWNYIEIDEELHLCDCFLQKGPQSSDLRILVTATHIGSDCSYPAWGLDNISKSIGEGCEMHDAGCLPALYPRPASGHYSSMHSGYYGPDFQFCPPYHFLDPGDTTETGERFGCLELAWRIRFRPVSESIEPTSWGSIKSLYR